MATAAAAALSRKASAKPTMDKLDVLVANGKLSFQQAFTLRMVVEYLTDSPDGPFATELVALLQDPQPNDIEVTI